MTPFTISRQAILQVIEGLALEIDKQSDSQLRMSHSELVWEESLVLSPELYEIDDAMYHEILIAVAEFFGIDTDKILKVKITDSIGNMIDVVHKCLNQKMNKFWFRPAGYQNDKDLCAHSVDSLFQQASGAASLLQGRRRLVLMVSPHSVLGFTIGALVPNLLGVDVIDARKMAPEQLEQELNFGDVIVATPTLWAYLMRENIKAPDNSMGVSFGEVMSLELAAKMRANGIGVLRELYGSTQSGLVAWRDSPNDDFVLFDYWEKAVDSDDELVRRFPDNQSYAMAPMDFINWKNNRTFSLKGRRDGAVQIGAVNVFPDRIAEALIKHKLIQKCDVKIANSKSGPNRLVANIYLAAKQSADYATAREVDNWCRAQLSIHERPHILNFFTTE